MKQRSVKVAGQQLDMPNSRLFPWAKELPLGIVLTAEPVKERQTDQQREGFHLLLSWWLDLDPRIARDLEELKTKVLIAKFGAAKVTDQHGNEAFIPLRRTTQIFDWDIPGYRRKLLSRSLYIELIDSVYRMASEDGIVLPDLEPEVWKREQRA